MDSTIIKYDDETLINDFKAGIDIGHRIIGKFGDDLDGVFNFLTILWALDQKKTIALLNDLFGTFDHAYSTIGIQFPLNCSFNDHLNAKTFVELIKDCSELKPVVYNIKVAYAFIQADNGGFFETAFREFEQLSKENTDNAKAFYGMAYCKEKLNAPKESYRLYDIWEKMIKKDPKQQSDDIDQMAWANKGLCCIRLSRFDEAKKCFKNYVDAIPDDSNYRETKINVMNYLGYAAAESNDFELAEKSFDRVLEKYKDNFGATVGKKLIAEKQNFVQEKRKLIGNTQENLKTLFTDVPSGLKNVGRMYVIQFAVGISFIVLAIILASLGINTLISGISGLAGTAITIVSLVNKAPVDLQRNRVNSAQWMIAYSNWINALYIVTSATDQLSKNNKEIKWEEMQQLQDYLTNLTAETIRNMKEYCITADISSNKEVSLKKNPN